MKAIKVYYEKCFNLGNYENEKIGIEVMVEDESAVEALKAAKAFVETQGGAGRAAALEKIMERNATARMAYESARKELNEVMDDCPF